MKGLIAAAGTGTRLQDLGEKNNKVLLDLGGETVLGNLLNVFEQVGISETHVVVGYDGASVKQHCHKRAHCILNPFFEHVGILGSVWAARSQVEGHPIVFTVGDHYFPLSRLETFLADQPEADILVDVELKQCDDEDMKVFLNRAGRLRTITKSELKGPVLGEMTGMVRFTPEGSRQFFEMMEKHLWIKGIQGYVADVLCTTHRKYELAFHLSQDHHRVEIDFPYDLQKARELYSQEQRRRAA